MRLSLHAALGKQAGMEGIIEYISPESIQALALYEQSLLTELIFAK